MIATRSFQGRAHISRQKSICDICSSSFCTSRELILHKASSHRKIDKFPCDQCGSKFGKQSLLDRHQRSGLKFQCKDCSIDFCSMKSLTSHNHNPHKCFKCDLCGLVYNDENMTAHMVRHGRSSTPIIKGQDLDHQLQSIKADGENKFTLAFTNLASLPFSRILAHFGKYSEVIPSIFKGPSNGMILISFESEEEASAALSENFENNEYPWLHLIPACKLKI